MTINNATVEQINVALLDIDKRIKALNTNSETIKSLQNDVKTIKSSLNETTRMPEALTVNGKTYNGSEAVDAGVQTVENGGTSATTAEDGFNTLADGVRDSSAPRDDEKILLRSTSMWYKTTCLDFWNYIKDKISSVLGLTKDNYSGKASTAGTADKAVEVVDYGDTSKTVKVGFSGSSVTADKLSFLAGYTENSSSSVKLKDIKREEVIKWLGIYRIKYADYQTRPQSFAQFEQVPINLAEFSPEITPDKVLCFMVIYWTGVQLIASADWGHPDSSGLKCALIALREGTGYAIIRCVYVV